MNTVGKLSVLALLGAALASCNSYGTYATLGQVMQGAEMLSRFTLQSRALSQQEKNYAAQLCAQGKREVVKNIYGLNCG